MIFWIFDGEIHKFIQSVRWQVLFLNCWDSFSQSGEPHLILDDPQLLRNMLQGYIYKYHLSIWTLNILFLTCIQLNTRRKGFKNPCILYLRSIQCLNFLEFRLYNKHRSVGNKQTDKPERRLRASANVDIKCKSQKKTNKHTNHILEHDPSSSW